jgi:hypothetical protein
MSDKTALLGNLSSVLIITPQGTTDISTVVTNIEVMESIFSPFVMGKITINDTESIRAIKKAKLKSDLSCKVDFSFSGLEDDGKSTQKEIKISGQDYYIYKVVQSTTMGYSTQTHEIYFAHRLFFKNEASNISRSFKKKKVSEVVSTLANRLGCKFNLFEQSDKKFNFVLPYRTIVAQINFLAPYARREEKPSDVNFLFYQDLSGKHNFVSVGKLMEQEPTFGNDASSGYVYGINRGEDFASARKAAIHHNIKDQSFYENAVNGMQSSAVMTLDPSEKLWAVTTYFLPDKWKKQSHISDKPIVPENSEMYDFVNGAFTQRFYMKARHSHCCKEQKNGNSKIGGPDDWLLSRVSQMEQLNQAYVEFTATGNSDIQKIGIGKIIYFGRVLLNESVNTSTEDKDIMGSGKYLIMTAVHSISRARSGKMEYTTSFKCCKDSLGEEH